MSLLETTLLRQIAALRLPQPAREHRFAALAVGWRPGEPNPPPGLRERLRAAGMADWRFDLAWPGRQLAVEIDGGTWSGGRHVRGAGVESDCRKACAAVLLGWRVLRVTGGMIKSGEAVRAVERALSLYTDCMPPPMETSPDDPPPPPDRP